MLVGLLLLAVAQTPSGFPIVGWWPPAPSAEAYAAYREAGFNVVPIPAGEGAAEALEAVRAAGLKALLLYPDLHGVVEDDAIVAWMLSGPATDGARVPDTDKTVLVEPEWDAVPAETVGASALAVRKFGLFKGGYEDDAGYLAALAEAGAKSRDRRLPLWGYVQATAHDSFREPSVSDLRFQVFALLAHGAKGLIYFTYTTPDPDSDEYKLHYQGWGPGIGEGNRKELRDAVRELNREVAGLAEAVLSLRYEGPDPTVLTERTEEALVTRLSGPEGTYLFVVNTRHGASAAASEKAKIALRLSGKVERFNPSRKRWEGVGLRDGAATLELANGSGTLLRLQPD